MEAEWFAKPCVPPSNFSFPGVDKKLNRTKETNAKKEAFHKSITNASAFVAALESVVEEGKEKWGAYGLCWGGKVCFSC
jgi:dienelactone hydrolase